MRFTITFHGPFRIGTGSSGPGVDETAHPGGIVPASSLKGLMRASARLLLPPSASDRDHPLVNEVFGDPDPGRPGRAASPWSWTDAEPPEPGEPPVRPHARVALDPVHGAVDPEEHALSIAQQVWAGTATFEILRTGFLDPADEERHELLLAGAAHAIHALGAERRRGLGWVTIQREDAPFDRDHVRQLASLRTSGRGGVGHA